MCMQNQFAYVEKAMRGKESKGMNSVLPREGEGMSREPGQTCGHWTRMVKALMGEHA